MNSLSEDFKKINGELVLEKIKVGKIAEKKVIKNNTTSGKVLLPRKLIGKTIYIIPLLSG